VRRPIIGALGFLCAGIAFGFASPGNAGWFIILIFSTAALSAAAICFAYRWPPAAVFFLCFVCGFLRVHQSLASDPVIGRWVENGAGLRMTGYALECAPTQTGWTRVTFDVYSLENGVELYPKSMRVLAILPESDNIETGDGAILRGKLENLDGARNPGAFNEYIYYKTRRVQYKCFPDVERVFCHNALPFSQALYAWRQRVAHVYDTVLPPEEASIAKAVILGDKTDIDGSTTRLFQSVGVSHILTISGMHISVISLIIYGLMGMFLDKRRAGVINLALLIVYCLFAGAGVSIIRAVVTAGVVIAGEILFRDRDMQSSVGFAAVCMLLYEPLYLLDIGFQLSFSAVFGIAILTGPVERLLGRFIFIPVTARRAASGSLAVTIGILPAMLFHFYAVTPYAFFANLIILPTTSVLVAAGVVTGCLGLFWINAAEFAVGAMYFLIRFYLSVCKLFQRIPGAQILTGCPGLWLTAAMALAILLFAYWFGARPGQMKKRGYLFAVSLCLCAVLAVIHSRPPEFEVTMLDVDQSDAFVIRQGGHVFVLDGGGLPNARPGSGTGDRVVVPYLNYLGVNRVDGVFVSHMDNDHAGGIIELLPQKRVAHVYLSYTVERGNEHYRALSGSCAELGVPISYLSKGDGLETGDFRINAVYPSKGDSGKGNESSLVLQFFYKRASVLFTGDIDDTVERRLEFASPTVLKLSHHGSKYGNGEDFIRKTAAPFALVSTGRRNVYGFPAPEVTGRLRDLNIPLYNTAETGAVTLSYKNGRYVIETMVKEGDAAHEGP